METASEFIRALIRPGVTAAFVAAMIVIGVGVSNGTFEPEAVQAAAPYVLTPGGIMLGLFVADRAAAKREQQDVIIRRVDGND